MNFSQNICARRLTISILLLLLCVFRLQPVSSLTLSAVSTLEDQEEKRLQNRELHEANSPRSVLRASSSLSIPPPVTASFDPQRQGDERALEEEEPDSYQKCYDTLDSSVDNQEGVLSPAAYVTFLQTMSNGAVQATQFSDLELIFIMIFYAAACDKKDCINQPPGISLDDSEASGDWLWFLCHQVLTLTFTTVEVMFTYSIRYDTDSTDEATVVECLEGATEHLLLDQLGQCSYPMPVERRQRTLRDGGGRHDKGPDMLAFWQKHGSRDLLQLLTDADITPPEYIEQLSEQPLTPSTDEAIISESQLYHRGLQQEDCSYTVDVQIQQLLDLPCNSPAMNDSTRCALVRSSANVVAEQLVEPDAQALRLKTIRMLRDAINSGGFVTYFADGCSFR